MKLYLSHKLTLFRVTLEMDKSLAQNVDKIEKSDQLLIWLQNETSNSHSKGETVLVTQADIIP